MISTLIRKWATVRTQSDPWEQREEVRKLAEVVKAFSKGSLIHAVKQHHSQPMLLSYSADPTPLRLKKVITSEGDDKVVVRRRGGHCVELLVLRTCLLTCISGDARTFVRRFP